MEGGNPGVSNTKMATGMGSNDVVEMQSGTVSRYAWGTTRVYRIPARSYLDHATNMYFVIDRGVTLIDVAIDTPSARADIGNGLQIVRREFGEDIRIEDVQSVVITHGHADHWGMLSNPMFKGKEIYIHALDSEVLRTYTTMRTNSRKRIARLIEEAGWRLSMDNLFSLDGLLGEPKDIRITEVQDGQKIIDGYTVHHVPGHSPGHICLEVGPVLFLGDLILSETTPLQIPPSMREGCGVRLYLDSLRKVAGLGDHLGLPAHEDTVYSVPTRVTEMEAFHYQRLVDILNLCREERTLFQITDEYYQLRPETINGKTLADLPRDEQILALEEIKAHVEYLIEDGRIAIVGMKDKAVLYRAA